MTRRVPPRVGALKKCMGLFPDNNYNASDPTYAPATFLGESAAAPEGISLGSPPSPFNVFAALDRSTTTGWISENRVVAMSVLFCLIVYFIISRARSPMRKLPPQPQHVPILGNLSQMRDKKWLFSRELKEQFGEVMYLDVFGKPTIVFNSLKSAFNVLERRARTSSGRPRMIVPSEILNQCLGLALMDHSDLWRRMRRASHESLTKSAAQRYHHIQTKEANILATSLLTNPEDRKQHFMRAGASMIMAVLYDYPTLPSAHDKAIEDIERSIRYMTEATRIGSSLVEFFPWMLHIPQRFAQWKRKVFEQRDEREKLYLRLFNRVRIDLANRGVRPSFTASLIEFRDKYRLSEKEIAYLSGQMYAAGSETTSTTLMWWMLAMIAFPEVQRRAHAELDAVVGRARLPQFSDAPRLPYVQAIVKEALRWRPAIPLGVPHRATEDDWYDGMFIPKGATLVANLWQCNHDRAVFGDDADEFRPERHLDDKGQLIPGPVETNQEGHASFGFGRRICVGKHVANESLFIHTARILWAATLTCAKDENGKDLIPDTSAFMDEGIVIRPVPYKCRITARFPEAGSLLGEEAESFES